MGSEEGFDQFLGQLRQAAARCQFGQLDDALRDQLIAGCAPRLQERVPQRAAEPDAEGLTLQHVVTIEHGPDGALWATIAEGLTLQDVITIAHAAERTDRFISEKERGTPKGSERAKGPRCYRCGQRGHLKRVCRQRPEAQVLAEHQEETEELRVADTLSRMPVEGPEDAREDAEEEDEPRNGCVLFVEDSGPALTARDIAAGTRRDPVLARVLAAARSGWEAVVDPELVPHKTKEEEKLSTEAGCVLWGGRVIVPRSLRSQVKTKLNKGRLGHARMKQLARRFVWWPGLDMELETLAIGCAACAAKRAEPPHSVRHPWKPAGGPWQRVHVDFAGPIYGSSYLVLVDSHTKWLEVVVAMKSTIAGRTVAVLRDVFARLGLPLQVVSDNGPQFVGEEFSTFLEANDIRHTRVAPYHPASNRLAERAVGTFKNGLKAAMEAGSAAERALATFLLAYRSSPHAVTGRTPAEMMCGRGLRTRLNPLIPSADATLHVAWEQQQQSAGERVREFRIGGPVWTRAYTADGLQLYKVRIPTHVKHGEDVNLACLYDLEGKDLYAIKWYKDGKEFYRYEPATGRPKKSFPQPGIKVNILGR
ncbi:uncharacterized protein K02A2.6-like [Pollicipes pollicipes]|uniref:uncharacterized protein K02A2.6-like n=1 Tax=Pollicipes pollicipes TaxID=41117 RepID=UPI001885101F|nr:uncharacterized protein K02A2.6-like [Pollicipes pollicipes]